MKQKEKVAIFTDSFDQINGVSNTFKQLVSYCHQKQYSLDVHTYGRERYSLETSGSVRIFRHRPLLAIPYYSDMFWDLGTPRFGLVREAAKESYDLIHVASPGSMGLNGLWVAHRNKIPLIGSYHTALPEYLRPRIEIFAARMGLRVELGARAESALWRYMQWFYNRCQQVLVPSHSTRIALEKRLRVPPTIFSRGVDVDRFHPRFRQQRERLTVLYVGRVSIEKNLDLLVRLFRHRTDVDLVVVGDGPYRSELRKHLPHATLLVRAARRAELPDHPRVDPNISGDRIQHAPSSGEERAYRRTRREIQQRDGGYDGYAHGALGRAYTLAPGNTFREFFRNIEQRRARLVAQDLTLEVLSDEMLLWMDLIFDAELSKPQTRLRTGLRKLDQGLEAVMKGALTDRPFLKLVCEQFGYFVSWSRLPAWYLQSQNSKALKLRRELQTAGIV
jgi:glycosyltransferase involved in cell wall biosynthesis